MHLDELLLSLLILLGVSAVCIALFEKLRLGSILGFLVAGIIAGPSGFAVAGQGEVEELRHVAELGVVLLLFVIGLEMEPLKLWAMRRLVFGLGTAQVLVTAFCIALYAMLFMAKGPAAVMMGLGLALSSTAFVIQILTARGDMATDYGKSTFSVLLLQDIAIVPLLAIVPVLADAPLAASDQPFWVEGLIVLALLAVVLVVARYGVPRALAACARARNMEAFSLVVLASVVGAAWIMDQVELSMALGAFLVGVMLSVSRYRHQIEAQVLPFKSILLGLFFISVGMSVDLNLLLEEWHLLALHVPAVLAIKILVLLGLGFAFRLGRGVTVRTAFTLSQCGEFGFVLFGAAVAAGLINDVDFAFAILFVSVTMVTTPLATRLGDAIAARLEGAPAPGEVSKATAEMRRVVIAGYGRVGRAICLMLDKSDVPYIVFDTDPARVALGRREGRKVHYGDATDARLLNAAGLDKAGALVVTVDEMKAAEAIAEDLLNLHADIPLHMRVDDLPDVERAKGAGVHHAVPVHLEGTLTLGSELLLSLGVAEDDVETLVGELRDDGYALMR